LVGNEQRPKQTCAGISHQSSVISHQSSVISHGSTTSARKPKRKGRPQADE
jgi:hypothetical protein